ncbi:hypothetical protein [Streptomyces nogalater]|uniref:Uncharacterized protein n=1 Tax=Streptomyces nogalater TaxID=38314 RepID=A0ABW0WE38_STRNO
MPIEYVPEFDEDGNHVDGYIESVPEYVKEEPDCYACNDAGCPLCDGTDSAPSAPAQASGEGYSDVPPFGPEQIVPRDDDALDRFPPY